MTTSNNVVSIENSVVARVESAILNALSNRAGKWVAPHIMTNAADNVATPNVNVFGVIDRMVQDGTLEKTFRVVSDKFDRAVQLPMYRLTPTYSW